MGNKIRIEEILKKRDYLGVYKVDEVNKTSEKIDVISRSEGFKNISDGTYVVDRGTGWILSGDESLVDTAIADGGISARINVSNTVGVAYKSGININAEVNIGWLVNTVQIALGKKITESDTLAFEFEKVVSAGKKLYMKAYATFKRYDAIKVINGEVITNSYLYEPEGGWVKYKEYNSNENFDANILIEHIDRCVLGEVTLNLNNKIKSEKIKSEDEEIKTKNEYNSMPDGTYVISKGKRVIRGEKESFIKSVIVPAGAIGSIEKRKKIILENSIEVTNGIGFNTEIVKATLAMVNGTEFIQDRSILAKYLNHADQNKDMFMKVYKVEEILETVRVKNGQVTDKAGAYNAVGTYAKVLSYEPNSTVNQDLLIQGDNEYEVVSTGYTKEVLDLYINKESKGVIAVDEAIYTSKSYKSGEKVAYLFEVPETSKYEFKTLLKAFSVTASGNPINQYGCNTNMRLVKLKKDSGGGIEKELFNVNPSFQTINNFSDFGRATGYEAELYKGEQYAIIIGPNHRFSNMSTGVLDISYKLRIVRKDKFEPISGIFRIGSMLDNNKVLDVNQSTENVFIYYYDDTNKQKWKLEYNEARDVYLIRNVADNRVLAWNSSKGLNVIAYPYIEGVKDQQWKLENAGNGCVIIKNVQNTNKVLELEKNNINNGFNVQVWDRNNQNHQKFKFIKL